MKRDTQGKERYRNSGITVCREIEKKKERLKKEGENG